MNSDDIQCFIILSHTHRFKSREEPGGSAQLFLWVDDPISSSCCRINVVRNLL